jgi:hypothetical protein
VSCLHLCPFCARHIKSVERACPFCTSDLPEDFHRCTPPSTGAVGKPLTRAALLFVSAAALGGCEKKGGNPNDPGNLVEVYGPAPVNVQSDAGPDAGVPKK